MAFIYDISLHKEPHPEKGNVNVKDSVFNNIWNLRSLIKHASQNCAVMYQTTFYTDFLGPFVCQPLMLDLRILVIPCSVVVSSRCLLTRDYSIK
jgi:hypothetical protein